MTQHPTDQLTADDVLLAFSAEANHDRATLESYLSRYPQYAEALAELAVELMLAPDRPTPTDGLYTPAVDNAWKIFQTSHPLETKSLGTAGSLLASLAPGAFRSLAQRLDVTTLFLKLVRDRAIAYSELPSKFIELLASELQSTVAALADDLQRPPMVAATERFKSDEKPAPSKQISFTEAIALSQLTPQQQKKLMALME